MKRLSLSAVALLAIAGVHAASAGDLSGRARVRVFQLLAQPHVNGEMFLAPVLVAGLFGWEPGQAVFTKWLMPYAGEAEVSYIQANRSYCDGLVATVRRATPTAANLDVTLDYTACKSELDQIALRSELDNIIEGSAAALLYTYNGVPGEATFSPRLESVTLHVRGYRAKPSDFDRTFNWQAIQQKWPVKPTGVANSQNSYKAPVRQV